MPDRVPKLVERMKAFFFGLWKPARKRLSEAKKCDVRFCPAGVFALARLPCGMCVMVKALDLAPEAANRLRQMGIREGCQIALLNRSEPLLVSIDNTRIALGTSLAEHIKVEAV